MTASVRPFAFPEVFAAEVPPRREAAALALEVELLELEVKRLKEELAGERATGRAEGHAEALAELRADRDTALLAAADALQASLEELDGRFDEAEATVTRIAAELALDAADYLAAQALERAPAAPIGEAIGRALRQVRRGEPIDVRVHPDLAERVQEMVDERQRQDRRRLFLTVIPDAALDIGDARLMWEKGSLALDRDARRAAAWGELESLLAPR